MKKEMVVSTMVPIILFVFNLEVEMMVVRMTKKL